MTRPQRIRQFLSRKGFRLLLLELVIVFLGVYGAFALQSWSEGRAIRAERERVLISLKEELEYFRIFFPGFTARDLIEERQTMVAEGTYRPYSDWRFLQPQYDYTAIEYALAAGVDVVDYELHAGLSAVYVELRKLRHVEELITEIAMGYRPTPSDDADNPVIRMAQLANLQGFQLLNDRARDRADILDRTAALSAEVLPLINRAFGPERLKQIELELIRKRLAGESGEALEVYLELLTRYFPELTEEEIRGAVQ